MLAGTRQSGGPRLRRRAKQRSSATTPSARAVDWQGLFSLARSGGPPVGPDERCNWLKKAHSYPMHVRIVELSTSDPAHDLMSHKAFSLGGHFSLGNMRGRVTCGSDVGHLRGQSSGHFVYQKRFVHPVRWVVRCLSMKKACSVKQFWCFKRNAWVLVRLLLKMSI